jgi:hypothetical protein
MLQRLLMDGGGLFWSLAYILIIIRGFKDKTYGMPLFVLCVNISWEFIFSFIIPSTKPQIYINYIWLVLDVFIVIQFLKFGKLEFHTLSNKQFYSAFMLALATSFGLTLSITKEFNDLEGAYAAFGDNLLMSILFIVILFRRDNLRGQSIYIGLFKMLGTALISAAFFLYEPIAQGSVLLPFLFISIFVYDLIYIDLIYQKYREHDISLLQRF